jgi:hypothetical protein
MKGSAQKLLLLVQAVKPGSGSKSGVDSTSFSPRK